MVISESQGELVESILIVGKGGILNCIQFSMWKIKGSLATAPCHIGFRVTCKLKISATRGSKKCENGIALEGHRPSQYAAGISR